MFAPSQYDSEEEIEDAGPLRRSKTQHGRTRHHPLRPTGHKEVSEHAHGGAPVPNRVQRTYAIPQTNATNVGDEESGVVRTRPFSTSVDAWRKPPSMPHQSQETVADAFRYFAEIRQMQERFKESNVYRFLCGVHHRSQASMDLLVEDYNLIMEEPDYNALFGELWQIADQMPAEKQLAAADSGGFGDMFQDLSQPSAPSTSSSSATTSSSGNTGPSQASTSSAGPVPPLTPNIKQSPGSASSTTPGTPSVGLQKPTTLAGLSPFDNLSSVRRKLQYKQGDPPQSPLTQAVTASTTTGITDLGTAIAYGSDALSDAIRGSLGSLESILLSDLRASGNLVPLVAAYEQRKASRTIQRMLRRNAAFEEIVFTPRALGAITSAMRLINTRYAHLRSAAFYQYLQDADVRADFSELVGFVLLEAATLPNQRGNIYVVTHSRIVRDAQNVLARFRKARVEYDNAVTYSDSYTSTSALPSTPLGLSASTAFPSFQSYLPGLQRMQTAPLALPYM